MVWPYHHRAAEQKKSCCCFYYHISQYIIFQMFSTSQNLTTWWPNHLIRILSSKQPKSNQIDRPTQRYNDGGFAPRPEGHFGGGIWGSPARSGLARPPPPAAREKNLRFFCCFFAFFRNFLPFFVFFSRFWDPYPLGPAEPFPPLGGAGGVPPQGVYTPSVIPLDDDNDNSIEVQGNGFVFDFSCGLWWDHPQHILICTY